MKALDDLDGLGGLVLFSIGRSPVTIGSVVAAVAVIVGGFFLARVIGRVMRRVRARATTVGGASLYIVEKVVTYGLVIAAIVAGVTLLGINLTSLAVFAGALGVGVGLGLQGVVKEFVSGLVLIFEGSIHVGDYIELDGGGRGEVQEIGPRATRIRNNDKVDILVPNSKLIGERVTTWTHAGGSRRIHIPFQVALGADRNLVRDAVLEAARAVPFTMPDAGERRSQVWLVGFGESALKFELLVWPELAAVKRPNAAQAAYNWAIADALAKHGIEIPYQQIDLRLRSLFGHQGDEALKTLKLKTPQAASPEAPAAPTTNDAAEDLAAARARDIAHGEDMEPPAAAQPSPADEPRP